jgi:hypothetical protein
VHYAVGMYGVFWPSIVSDSRPEPVTKDSTPEEILSRHCQIPLNDIVYSFFETEKAVPAHAICLDHAKSAIVLAVRGSLSFFDFMMDAECEYDEHEFLDWVTGEVKCVGLVH